MMPVLRVGRNRPQPGIRLRHAADLEPSIVQTIVSVRSLIAPSNETKKLIDTGDIHDLIVRFSDDYRKRCLAIRGGSR
jgi:hypothetical protein